MSLTIPSECPSCGLMAIDRAEPVPPDLIYHCHSCDDWAWWDHRINDWSPAPTRSLAEEHYEHFRTVYLGRIKGSGADARGGGDIPPATSG